jgi:hypothetical protein
MPSQNLTPIVAVAFGASISMAIIPEHNCLNSNLLPDENFLLNDGMLIV